MPTSITAAAALSRYASNTLPLNSMLADTASNVMADIDLLFPLFKAGDIGSIAITDSTAAAIFITADQLRTESGLLGKITGNFSFTVSGSMTAGQLLSVPTPLLPRVSGGIALVDTASAVMADIDLLYPLFQLGAIGFITITGSTPAVIAITTAQLRTEAELLGRITGNFSFSVVGRMTADQLLNVPTPLLQRVTGGIALADTAHALSADIDLLFPLFKAGDISSIGVTDLTPSVISITADQLRNEGGLLARINGAFTFSVSGSMTAGQLMGISLPLRQHIAGGVVVADTAANVALRLGALWTMVQLGEVQLILLTDSPQSLSITAAQLSTETSALQAIAGTYDLRVSGTLTVAQLLAVPISIVYATGPSGGIRVHVADTAAHVQAAFDALSVLGEQTALGSILFTDAGTPTIKLTAAQFAFDGAAVAAIASPYTLTITGSLTVAQIVSLSGAQLAALHGAVAVSDKAANVMANFATLQTLAVGGQLGAITLTDATTPTFHLTGNQIAPYAGVFAAITSAFLIDPTVQPHTTTTSTSTGRHIQDYGLVGVSFPNLAAIPASLAAHFATPLTVYENATAANLDQLQDAFAAGKIGHVTMSGWYSESYQYFSSPGSFSEEIVLVPYAQITISAATLARDAGVLAHIGVNTDFSQFISGTDNGLVFTNTGQITAYGYIAQEVSLTVLLDGMLSAAAALQAARTVQLGGSLAVVDSAANIAANLDALVAAHVSIASITLTDAGTPVIALTAAQLATDGVALSRIVTPYRLLLSGVPGVAPTTIDPTIAPRLPQGVARIDATVSDSNHYGVQPLAISNDGQSTVLLRQGAVVLVNASGLTKTLVSSDGAFTADPGIAPELRYLMFNDSHGNLQLLDAASGTERHVTSSTATVTSATASASADGAHAVYWVYSGSDSTYSLTLTDFAGGNHVLATSARGPGVALISADGASVVYSANGTIDKVNISTLADTRLYTGILDGNATDLTRDGRFALAEVPDNKFLDHFVRIDTSNGQTVEAPFVDGKLSQDGRYLIGLSEYDFTTHDIKSFHVTVNADATFDANQTADRAINTSVVTNASGSFAALTDFSVSFTGPSIPGDNVNFSDTTYSYQYTASASLIEEYNTYLIHTPLFTPSAADGSFDTQARPVQVLVSTGDGQDLLGAGSAPTYYIAAGNSEIIGVDSGPSTIIGFNATDRLSFDDATFGSVRQVLAHTTQGGDLVIFGTPNDSVIARGFSPYGDSDVVIKGAHLTAAEITGLPAGLAPTLDYGTLGIVNGHRVWTPKLTEPDQVATTVTITGSVTQFLNAPNNAPPTALPVTILSGVETLTITATDTGFFASTTKVYADAASSSAPVSFIAPTGYDLNILIGGGGNDTLTGRTTADYFLGNGGSDVFVMGSGKETVWDWNAATDKINVAGSGFTSIADVLNHTSNNGTEAFITRPIGGYIDLKGGDLTAANILLS